MSRVRYRVLNPDEYSPPENHAHLNQQEYIAPESAGPDTLEVQGDIEVLGDVLWKPMRQLHKRSDLPGRALESPPRIEFDEEWYFKAVAPLPYCYRHMDLLAGDDNTD